MVALGVLFVLILLFGGYLMRAIAVPVRGAAAMAGRLAGGDLAVRLPETGMGEVGALQRAFNSMAGSLQANRDELHRLADEQAALRRVATLVAREVPTAEVFEAVTREVGLQCDADLARMARLEPDRTVTAVAAWEIEASAYFLVAETLTNVAKHSRAQAADVRTWVDDSTLHIDVRDDGVGGARSDGSGLLGLADRVSTLGGRLHVESPPGEGTRLSAWLPLAREDR